MKIFALSLSFFNLFCVSSSDFTSATAKTFTTFSLNRMSSAITPLMGTRTGERCVRRSVQPGLVLLFFQFYSVPNLKSYVILIVFFLIFGFNIEMKSFSIILSKSMNWVRTQ